MHKTNLAVQ